MSSIRIGSFLEILEVDYEQPPLFTWKEFYDFRNNVLRVLRRFGSAGPMGEVNLSTAGDDAPDFESTIVDDPAFFVVDDMYNEHNRLSLVECDPKHINAELILSLCEMASRFPGWHTDFRFGDSGLRVSAETVFKGGRRFWDCETVDQLAERCARPVDFGLAGPLPLTMYRLWFSAVCGEFQPSADYGEPPDRQWAESIQILNDESRRRKGKPLSSFSYDAIRNELHPEIRRQFVSRSLVEISSISPGRLKAAKRNIQRDAGEALSNSANEDERVSLARIISQGQEDAVDKLEPKEIVFWWANILHSIKDPRNELKRVLTIELWRHLEGPNSLIRLSSIFALARLRTPNIASIVDDVMKTNPHWGASENLMKWLGELRAGSTSYPNGLFLVDPTVYTS